MSEAPDKAKTADKVKAPKSDKPQRSAGGFALFLAFLALLLSSAVAAYLAYQYQNAVNSQHQDPPWRAEMADLQTALQQRLAVLGDQQQQLREQMQSEQQAMKASLQEQQKNQLADRSRLLMLDQQLQGLTRIDRFDWMLAEAEYLLRLARYRLQLGETDGVDGLLQGAGKRLMLLPELEAEAVRKLIEQDRQAVAEAGAFDLRALSAELDTLSQQALALEPFAEREVEGNLALVPAAAPELAGQPLNSDTALPKLKALISHALERLQSYIRVSSRDTSYQFQVIAAGQTELFKQNLQLLFNQAQAALIAGQPELYQGALTRAEDWLRRYYPQNEAADVLTALAAIKQRTILPPKPVLDGSINALAAYLESRHVVSVEAKP